MTHSDPLLAQFMPTYDIHDRHEVAVAAPADVTLAAAKEIELDDSRLVRAIFRARELLLRSAPDPAARPKGLFEAMKSIGWVPLAETPDREVVMGAVTRPWEANPVFRAVPADQFAAFAEPDHVKIVWTLRADPTASGSLFRTETRAVATDRTARRMFRRYWALLSPGIRLIRVATMPLVKAAAERRWRLEGDDILADAHAQLTHATTIEAPAKDVWPWLLQMGAQRAGWYSWDILDNGGKPSADRIIPKLQQLAVGDVLPARPKGAEGFEVVRMVPERALVLSGTSADWAGTWSFVLEPVGANQARLVTRYRAAYPPSLKMAIFLPVISAVHTFMERKQLRTIKHHAERLAAQNLRWTEGHAQT